MFKQTSVNETMEAFPKDAFKKNMQLGCMNWGAISKKTLLYLQILFKVNIQTLIGNRNMPFTFLQYISEFFCKGFKNP